MTYFKLQILFILLLLFSDCNSRKDVNKIGMVGVMLFEKGDYRGALYKFNRVIELDSLNSEAYMRKADCLGLLGDIPGSIENYSKSIEIDSANIIALFNRANTYEQTGEFDKAISDYLAAIEYRSSTTEIPDKILFMNLGILYGQMNQLDKAIDAFSEAILLDINFADAYHNRGFAYQLKGEHETAIQDFDQAVSINPNEQLYQNSRMRSLVFLSQHNMAY